MIQQQGPNRAEHEPLSRSDAVGSGERTRPACCRRRPAVGLGCATHSLPGHLPLRVNIYDRLRDLVQQLVQS
jgi:hypothetical protein